MADTLDSLYSEMGQCSACKLRGGCNQVVLGAGQRVNPLVVIIGESPGQQEDEQGEPFVGNAGQVLREVLRKVGLNRTNTLITNTVKCRPPGNKFPKDDCPEVCVTKWLSEEIRLASPKRMILLGGQALSYVAGIDGITNARGKYVVAHGVQSMPTFHPSYVIRKDNEGITAYHDHFAHDIAQVASEVLPHA